MGFPYPNNISFQRMLKYQLQKTNPDKDIEIINLALTAINSYTFYDFAQELVHFEPDAIFIYGGHNEYYGALGEPDMKAMPRMYVPMKLANHRPRAALLFGSAPTASQTWPIRGAMMEVLA